MRDVQMILFFKVFLTEFIAEMGDKTQLMLIALTSKYKLRDIILGTAAAILVLNGLAVLAGGLVSEFIPAWLIKIIAAFAFLYFAASTLAGDDDEEEEGSGKSRIRFAPLAVFCTFFVAELGDKTQLTTITFGANEGMSAAVIVWIACSLGLFAADILGMLVGYLLKEVPSIGDPVDDKTKEGEGSGIQWVTCTHCPATFVYHRPVFLLLQWQTSVCQHS